MPANNVALFQLAKQATSRSTLGLTATTGITNANRQQACKPRFSQDTAAAVAGAADA